MQSILTNRLDRGFYKYQEEFEQKAIEVLRSGWYILGKEVELFEKEFSDYNGTQYAVGVASGLDALVMACRILGIGEGDEVLVQGNAYIASVMGISINGATPVFVEPDDCYQIDIEKIEEKITGKTKAIMVVQLFGQAPDMRKIKEIAETHNLYVIEDCAQSHGAMVDGQKVGTFGDISCFSFYPSKNLGAFGDAGALLTNNQEYANKARIIRNYGSEKRYYNQTVGMNSRLDEMQAGLLRVRLKYLDELNNERIEIANFYSENIKNELLFVPHVMNRVKHVWHQYVIRCKNRDNLVKYLDDKGIKTLIHYPIPPHMSDAYAYLGYTEGSLPITERYAKEILSLPIYNGMTLEEMEYVVQALNEFGK